MRGSRYTVVIFTIAIATPICSLASAGLTWRRRVARERCYAWDALPGLGAEGLQLQEALVIAVVLGGVIVRAIAIAIEIAIKTGTLMRVEMAIAITVIVMVISNNN